MKWDDPNRVDMNMGPLLIQDVNVEITKHKSHGWDGKNSRRGKRGGVHMRLKRQKLQRIPLPSIILANVQSLRNKTDELQGNTNYLHEYRNACIMAFSKTWLMSTDSDPEMSLSIHFISLENSPSCL